MKDLLGGLPVNVRETFTHHCSERGSLIHTFMLGRWVAQDILRNFSCRRSNGLGARTLLAVRINAMLVHIVVQIPQYIVGCEEPSRGASRARPWRPDLSRSADKRNSGSHCGTNSGAYLIGLEIWIV